MLKDFQKAFETVDVILTPTSPPSHSKSAKRPTTALDVSIGYFYNYQSLAGVPAISIPCGKNAENMPVGMQLVGNHFQESLLLNVAYHFEKTGGFTV
jgi:aspartyl-tRNA(Asn)/glutamyl-tRNA(Gln) amidotransferase subunit A